MSSDDELARLIEPHERAFAIITSAEFVVALITCRRRSGRVDDAEVA